MPLCVLLSLCVIGNTKKKKYEKLFTTTFVQIIRCKLFEENWDEDTRKVL